MNIRGRRIRPAVLAGVACLLVLGVLFVVIPRPKISGPEITLVGVSVAGDTNRATATFTLTNPYKRRITCIPFPAQFRKGAGWGDVMPTAAGMRSINLEANQSTQITVSVWTNSPSWRLPVVWFAEPSDLEALREIALVNWKTFKEHGHLAGLGFGLPGATNFSDEVAGWNTGTGITGGQN